MKININDFVHVKLTEYGEQILIIHMRKEWKFLEENGMLHEDNIRFLQNKYIDRNFQLWELMNIFGSEMKIGKEQVFVNNEIILEKSSINIENINVSGKGNVGLCL